MDNRTVLQCLSVSGGIGQATVAAPFPFPFLLAGAAFALAIIFPSFAATVGMALAILESGAGQRFPACELAAMTAVPRAEDLADGRAVTIARAGLLLQQAI